MNQKILSVFIICTALVIWNPLSTLGQEKAPNYATLKIGQYSPTGDLDDLGFDSKVDLELLFGHYFNENFALEAGIGIFGSDREEGDLNVYFTAFALPVLTAKAVLPKKRFEFYGGGGIGYYQAKYDYNYFAIDIEESDTAFGYHVVAGFSYDFTPYWYLGLEGKQIWTDDFDFKVVKIDGDGRTLTFNVGLRW
ncbi:MAG: porin family protein [Deltaproteobacteria bacterium]|nr:porin family protein [Deltaproteobacteria bacterium]